MNSLRFNEVDLEANREGRLTDAQHKRRADDLDLLRQQNKAVVISIAAMCAIRAVMDGLQRYDKVDHDVSRLLSGENLGTILIPFVVFIIIASIIVPLNWWMVRRFARSTVHSVEGRVQIIHREKRFLRSAVYNVKIWRNPIWWMMFRFDDAESLAYFESGQHYRVYYLSYFDRPQALSAEEIDEKDKR